MMSDDRFLIQIFKQCFYVLLNRFVNFLHQLAFVSEKVRKNGKNEQIDLKNVRWFS